jgi:hypothetical protein
MTPPKVVAKVMHAVAMDHIRAPMEIEVEGRMALARRVPGMARVMLRATYLRLQADRMCRV